MQDIKFTIKLPPVSKKNSQQIFKRADGRRFIAPSKAYQQYEKQAGWFLQGGLRGAKIARPVNVKCLYYMEKKKVVDLPNLINATLDVLTEYGVLADDESRIVVSTDGSRVLLDRENPRTEVTISFYE